MLELNIGLIIINYLNIDISKPSLKFHEISISVYSSLQHALPHSSSCIVEQKYFFSSVLSMSFTNDFFSSCVFSFNIFFIFYFFVFYSCFYLLYFLNFVYFFKSMPSKLLFLIKFLRNVY